MTADIDAKERKLALQTFASFKFDMMDAMMVDHRLKPSDFKVGYALLHFMNGSNGDTYPSNETLAEVTGLSMRTILYCLENLRDTGWITWWRGNRQRSNDYDFDIANLGPMQIRRASIDAARHQRKRQKSSAPDTQPIAGRAYQSTSLTRNQLQVATCNPLQPNTYIEPLKRASR
ncbi:MAG: helix-turn-helix domain-containing protein [Cypionkella sp.]